MWTPNFDFANLYTQRHFDLDLFKSNCVCKHMPLKGSQFTEGDKCLYYIEELYREKWVNIIKENGTQVSTYSFDEFKNYFL